MPTTYEPQDTPYVVGDQLNPSVKSDNSMAGLQASEVFHVRSNTPIGAKGESEAFAKRSFGASAEVMMEGYQEAKYPERGPVFNEFKDRLKSDYQNAGNAAPLFMPTEASQDILLKVDLSNMRTLPDYGALTPKLATLNTRAVATSEINKAMELDILSEEKHGVDADGKPLGLSGKAPGVAVLTRPDTPGGQEKILEINYADAEVQHGLYDLEALDYITGQIDRHAGNIFVDPQTGKVTGIDNDLALPEVARDQMLKDGTLAAKAVRNPPYFMHEDTAAKIEAMTPEALEAAIRKANAQCPNPNAQVSDQAIEGAKQRLKELQAEIKVMRAEGRVVPEFNQKTYDIAKAHQESAIKEDVAQQRQRSPRDDAPSAQELAAVPRTSYVGTVIIEQERTKVMQDQRITVDGNAIEPQEPLGVLEQYAEEKAALKAKFRDDPSTHNLANVSSAGVPKAVEALEAAEQKVQQAHQRLDALKNPQQAASGWNRVSPQKAIEDAQQQLEKAVAEKVQCEKKLDAALEKAVEPLKPQIEHNAQRAIEEKKPRLDQQYRDLIAEKMEIKKDIEQRQSDLKKVSPEKLPHRHHDLSQALADRQAELKAVDAKIQHVKKQLIELHQKAGQPVPQHLAANNTRDAWDAKFKADGPRAPNNSNANSMRNNFAMGSRPNNAQDPGNNQGVGGRR